MRIVTTTEVQPCAITLFVVGSNPIPARRDLNTEETFWVYVLENPAGQFYIGSSDDRKRLEVEHNDANQGRKTYTHKNGPWKLVWREPHPNRSVAMKRERQIKIMNSVKWIRENLLIRSFPTRRSSDLCCRFESYPGAPGLEH